MIFAALLFHALSTLVPAGTPEGRSISGTIVVEGANSALDVPKTGSIQFWLGGRGGLIVEAAVRDGAFRAELPYDGWLDIGPIELDGTACWSVPDWDDRSLPAEIALVARRVRPTFVRFVDTETGTDLRDVTLTIPDGSPRELDTVALASAASPIEVPLFAGADGSPRGWIGMREYLVSSPGRASRRVWIDPSEGGTRTFELAREACLDVRTPLIAAEVASYEVRIQRPDAFHAWSIETIPPDGIVQLCGLPAGRWHVRLAVAGSSFDEGLERVEVTLAAGVTSAVEIGTRSTDLESVSTLLHGTLRLPPGMDRASIRIAFAPDGALARSNGRGTSDLGIPPDLTADLLVPDPHDARLFHWHAGRVRAGSWWISLATQRWSQLVRASEDYPVAIVVEPDPAGARPIVEVVARFVDGPSRRELGLADIDVRTEARDWSVRCAVGETAWTVRARESRFTLFVQLEADPSSERSFAVNAEHGEHTFVLWPTQRIVMQVYDGDTRVGAPEVLADLRPTAQPVGHGGRAVCPGGSMFRENTSYFLVEGPGRYRIALRGDARYAPTEPVEVDVKLGEAPPVAVFRLTRAKH